MKLFIDDREADIDSAERVSISVSIASVTKIETGRTGYSKAFKVPATMRNREIFGDAGEINSIKMFNSEAHPARIESEGCTVIAGMAMLARYETSARGSGYYLLNIIGPGKKWIKAAAENMFRELPLNFSTTMTPATIADSWTDTSPVKFFPVQYDYMSVPSDIIQGCSRILTSRDYHPFIRIRDIMDTVAAQGGYTISSGFMDSEFFRSLYMSGRYPETHLDGAKEMMGFKAKRLTAATATADSFGRVYADPWASTNSLGNIVNSANPLDFAANDPDGIYNTNNVFDNSGTMISFTPLESVRVGFEYHFRYRTDYVIQSRLELKCFNRIYLDDMTERRFKVLNRNTDQRAGFKDRRAYNLIVFGHAQGQSYRFTYNTSGSGADVILKTFNTRTTPIQTNLGTEVSNPKLWTLSGGSYTPYTGDWALYDGYVTETGKIDVDLTVRSRARTFTPSAPHHFDLIHFGGAHPGMAMTLSAGATLKPVFTFIPTDGDTINFEDVAAHEVRQIKVVNAVKHMFNLYFYTDDLTKTIYIEPMEQFYMDHTVDWSDKTDLSKPVTCEELGSDLYERLYFRYQEGDGTVARWDQSQKQTMGMWTAQIENIFAREGTEYYHNPLFTPTISRTGVYSEAPTASVIQVGDRAAKGLNPDPDNPNFPAKVVRFDGMKPLPPDSWWGWPGHGTSYPKISFHNTTDTPFTLCFEDRDGIAGLHTYYDRNIELYNHGKRITVYMNLRAQDVEPFIIPNDLKADFRALFRIKLGGETVMCRLEEIVDYDPRNSGPTKCIFITHI